MLRWLRRRLGGMGDPGLWVTVRCGRCGEEIRLRVDRQHEARWEPTGEAGEALVLDKEVLGTQCPNLMRLHLEFDARGAVREQRMDGGTLVEAPR